MASLRSGIFDKIGSYFIVQTPPKLAISFVVLLAGIEPASPPSEGGILSVELQERLKVRVSALNPDAFCGRDPDRSVGATRAGLPGYYSKLGEKHQTAGVSK